MILLRFFITYDIICSRGGDYMFTSKGKGLPIIITIMLIVIIIYLFATVEQPLVVCEKKVTDDLDITVSEVLETTLDGKEIKKWF